jgi:hypothetical protein
MVAAIGTGDAFTKGRDFAAWLGLVPKQMSTGDRTILGNQLEIAPEQRGREQDQNRVCYCELPCR